MYESLDFHLQSLLDDREIVGSEPREEFSVNDQRINDQAYFVLAWGQLEADVDEACRDVIRSGQSQQDWRFRRIWSLYDPDSRRLSGLSFENRLSLVLSKSSTEWKTTMKHYELRNRIAHGKLYSSRIDVGYVIQQFSHISEVLARE